MKFKYPKKQYYQKSITLEFILECDSMISVMEIISQVARYDVNILLLGESGTGKEMLAKIIHMLSPRAANPFVPINCGVLSGLMFEDKLFGHEKGAFTGAIDRKEGSLELADKGTLFLDEVSELPLQNQVDFLRVLEDFRFTRIGGNETIEVDIRIISATNKDLKEEIRRERFREDLFYRLQVVPVYLPPLRERKKAIPKMVDHFLEQFELTYKKAKPAVTQEVIDIFLQYEWPGNVRELKNLVERIFILNEGDRICCGNLPPDFLDNLHVSSLQDIRELAEVRKAAESMAIINALEHAEGDREQAAEILKISPRTLRYKLRQYRIRPGGKGETGFFSENCF
ncbi:MAG: sigma-54 dependent transcriptional regulator [Desulfococcaceae bacterium]|jgi:transcriptional regulator with PAS, ATPase and Fis domain|nr:sigma-54 dependent transcriptional regulator [Desulfococcaceae bacterium]